MSPTFILKEGLAVNCSKRGNMEKFYFLFFTWNNQVYIQQFHRLGPDFGLCQNGPNVPKFITNFQKAQFLDTLGEPS